MSLSKSDIVKIYSKRFNGRSHHVDEMDIQFRFLNYLLHELAVENPVILDAGCGSGKYSIKLQEKGLRNIFSVDLFSNSVQHNKLKYLRASIDALPIKNNYFNLVFSFSVIFYLTNPEKAIEEFSRVLKTGGIFLMTAHTKYSLFTLVRCLKRFIGLKSMSHLDGVKFYSASEYISMLNKHNFEIMYVDGYTTSIFFYPIYKKISAVLRKATKIILPQYHQSLRANRVIAKLRSVFAYHSIIVAKKVDK